MASSTVATLGGRPLAGSYLDNGPFREIRTKAGIKYGTRDDKGLRFHDLRQSAATILLVAACPGECEADRSSAT